MLVFGGVMMAHEWRACEAPKQRVFASRGLLGGVAQRQIPGIVQVGRQLASFDHLRRVHQTVGTTLFRRLQGLATKGLSVIGCRRLAECVAFQLSLWRVAQSYEGVPVGLKERSDGSG
jgi:hypothetical protein